MALSLVARGAQALQGTIIKYKPTKGSDTLNKDGNTVNIRTLFHCISAAYSLKSLEELRFEYYSAGHGSGCGAGLMSGTETQGPGEHNGGYEYNFIDEVPDSLSCPICSTAAQNPYQVNCCGKIFCKCCLDEHEDQQRISSCPACRKCGYTKFQDKRSERDILSLKVQCTFSDGGCKWEGELRDAESHVKKCSTDIISCPYAAVGCSAKIHQRHLDVHKGSVDHLEMAMKMIKSLSDQLEKVQKDHLEMTTKYMVQSISDHLQKLVLTPSVPPVVFKMESFASRREDCEQWDSSPFYTRPRGYKLYLKVYPAGIDGDDSYVSVFVHLMRGEYDDDLVWPFRGTITFQILNQAEDDYHLEGTAKFLDKRSTPRNCRVTFDDGKSREGLGEPNLLDLNDLDDEDYVLNDCLYIRVSEVKVAEYNKPWLI